MGEVNTGTHKLTEKLMVSTTRKMDVEHGMKKHPSFLLKFAVELLTFSDFYISSSDYASHRNCFTLQKSYCDHPRGV